MKTILLGLFAGLVLAGCATAPKTDWAARVGHYTYDQAVLELGPPDKVAKLDNGIIVADWITQSAQTVGPTGPYLIRPGYYGVAPGGYGPTYFPAWYLRLTFGTDGKLTAGKNIRSENRLSPARRACFTGGVNVDLGIWSKLTKVVVGLVVLAVLLLIGMCYLPVIRQNEQLRRQILLDQTQIETEQDRSRKLQAQVDALLHDQKTVERLTREKLGYAKPDETVIRFEAPATNSPPRY